MSDDQGASGATDSDRILAAGVPVTLADGVERTVRFSMRSLKAIEDHFGSLEDGLTALSGVFPKEGKPARNRKRIGTVVPFLAAGLIDSGVAAPAVWDLVAFADLNTYLDVVAEALDQALPKPAAAGGTGKADGTPPSDGTGSTTPPPDGSAAPTPSSGG
jgi:hypothetical protein